MESQISIICHLNTMPICIYTCTGVLLAETSLEVEGVSVVVAGSLTDVSWIKGSSGNLNKAESVLLDALLSVDIDGSVAKKLSYKQN